MTYEEAMKQLEEIACKLEKGDISLDESINLYEKAMELSKVCTTALENAAIKIKQLSELEEKAD
ncbi:MAG: exodeoxyribonuclease VII small subunit [Acutalibacteraceae bacterium]|nr:exodeoxyribonuclease VII small subunit [Acutalibacteraceae bacterium]